MVFTLAIAPAGQVYRYVKVSNAFERQQSKWWFLLYCWYSLSYFLVSVDYFFRFNRSEFIIGTGIRCRE